MFFQHHHLQQHGRHSVRRGRRPGLAHRKVVALVVEQADFRIRRGRGRRAQPGHPALHRAPVVAVRVKGGPPAPQAGQEAPLGREGGRGELLKLGGGQAERVAGPPCAQEGEHRPRRVRGQAPVRRPRRGPQDRALHPAGQGGEARGRGRRGRAPRAAGEELERPLLRGGRVERQVWHQGDDGGRAAALPARIQCGGGAQGDEGADGVADQGDRRGAAAPRPAHRPCRGQRRRGRHRVRDLAVQPRHGCQVADARAPLARRVRPAGTRLQPQARVVAVQRQGDHVGPPPQPLVQAGEEGRVKGGRARVAGQDEDAQGGGGAPRGRRRRGQGDGLGGEGGREARDGRVREAGLR